MVTKQTSLQITPSEFQSRCDRLLDHIHGGGLTGVVLFDRDYILYYTGFAFIPTERPISFVLNAAGERALFVPRLEVEHARANSLVQRVDHYLEYPGDQHPMAILKQTLAIMGVRGEIGVDYDGYPWMLGYRGPSLSEITGRRLVKMTTFIEEQMMIKSPAELALIRESIKWGHLAHMLLQRYTQVGASETEVSQRASMEANRIMLDTIGPLYRAQSPFSEGVGAGYRGQIGRNAAIPHALANNITFQAGDVLVSGANAPVWGYNSELERTMIVGPATAEQKRMFEAMVALQDTAFASIRPGVKCADVDRAVRTYYEAQGLMSFWKHHIGHAIGLRYHEGPFLDLGDQTVIEPGMVFTVEPGLYSSELGGFRHSDMVVVVEDGIEIMTYYPRHLESLTI
ncbi:MAG TPA: Xaa-Pro peptidase family protein [Anaerolineales bacterium]|nr:Xaa-Pro peptidase family protein [Anaerolineales bacterium]